MQRVRMEYKRRYKRRQLASLESRAVKRIVRMLAEDEGYAAAAGSDNALGGSSSRQGRLW